MNGLNSLFNRRNLTTFALLLVMGILMAGCTINPNADVSEHLTNAGTEVKAWIPLLRILVYGLLACAWVWYAGIYAVSLIGLEQYWQKHRDWWKGAAFLTFGLGIITETVIGFIG